MVVYIKQAFTFKKNKPEKTRTAQKTLGYLRPKLYEKVVIVAMMDRQFDTKKIARSC